MWSKKRSGHETKPCGTPDVTGTFDKHSPSNTTPWVRPTRKKLIHF